MQPFTLRSLSPGEVERLYLDHMKSDFPPAERPPLKTILRQVETGFVEAFVMTDGTKDYAYVLAARYRDYVLYTHLAVFSGNRGGGLGSALMDLLSTSFASATYHIVEVENPGAAEDAEARQLMERRIAFYMRAGYAVVPDIRYILFGVDMLLMTRGRDGLSQPSAAEVAEVMRNLYESQIPEDQRHQFSLELLSGKS